MSLKIINIFNQVLLKVFQRVSDIHSQAEGHVRVVSIYKRYLFSAFCLIMFYVCTTFLESISLKFTKLRTDTGGYIIIPRP